MVFLMFQVVTANLSTVALLVGIVVIFSAFFIAKATHFCKNFIIDPVISGVTKIFEELKDIIGDLIPSDKRLKENITLIGQTDSDQNINVYRYNYIHDPKKKTYVGILAQELEYTPYQDCLSSDQSGLLRINYKKLGLHYEDKSLPFEEE